MTARAASFPFRIICACWLLAAPGFSQAPPTLLSARELLGDIARHNKIPPCSDAVQLLASKNKDALFLTQRLKQAGWKSVDPDYVASLDSLFKALVQIAGERDTNQACDRLRLVVSDLHTKRQDCEALGHSRTNIRVEVLTEAGNGPLNGLEIYWRWLPRGDQFDTDPKRLSKLSSPALGNVPVPGEYELFAKDPASGRTTHPERVSIGGTEVFHWSLPITFEGDVKP